MHVLVVGMNYAPEQTAIGPLTTELCEHLVSQGHRVSVITGFPHFPEWKVHNNYKKKILQRENIKGVSVYRGYVYVPSQPRNALQRIIYDTSICISSFLWGLTIRRVDVILVVSPPLQLCLTAYYLSKIRNCGLIMLIQDIVPDAAIDMGIIKDSIVIKIARKLERYVYIKVQTIIVICQGFVNNLKNKGVPDSKIVLLPNWVDTDFIRPLVRNNIFRQKYGIAENRFLVLHAGNVGVKQGLENVLKTAKEFKSEPDILFYIVGGGNELDYLAKLSNEENLNNVRFLPLQPKEMLPHMLSAADALIINQRSDVVDIVIPSKLYTYMASGRPIIAAVHPKSEAGRYITMADCGLVIPPEQPKVLADAIRQVKTDSSLADRYGRNARKYLEENFDRKKILKKFTAVLERSI
ncbi:MAG: WcaI family glycosyltransferase [Nitrospirae bacterium]|nr:WcaI family glycosyltransferase [Nitrospirota bacterium]